MVVTGGGEQRDSDAGAGASAKQAKCQEKMLGVTVRGGRLGDFTQHDTTMYLHPVHG